MKLVIIGTDHRVQYTHVQDDEIEAWVLRNGGHRYCKLIALDGLDQA
jgi:hypothetical protein